MFCLLKNCSEYPLICKTLLTAKYQNLGTNSFSELDPFLGINVDAKKKDYFGGTINSLYIVSVYTFLQDNTFPGGI